MKNVKKWLSKAVVGALIAQVLLFSGMATSYAAGSYFENYAVTPISFNPDSQTAEVSFDLTTSAIVTINVINKATNAIEYTLVDGNMLAGVNKSFTWYGTENNNPLGAVLDDGQYNIYTEAKSTTGGVFDVKYQIVTIYSDIVPPVITLLGTSPVTVEAGSVYTDAGATATDDVDGNITASIVVGGDAVDTSTLGTYVITYNVSDAAGNPATVVTRTVNVVDTTIPVITLLGTDPMDVLLNAIFTDPGYTANDTFDGDITASVFVGGDAVNTSSYGTYVITYNVSDSSGNPAVEVTRTVNVIDTEAPVITLLGSEPMDVAYNTVFTDPGATALDTLDGDITASIVVGGDVVNTSTLGTYVITYNVSDSSGNPAVEVTRTVNVIDAQAPVITLLGTDPVNLELGNAYVDAGATALDDVDGDLTAGIAVGGDAVDTSALGTYVISYNISDSAGNPATEVTRTVNVVAVEKPVITLTGSATVEVVQGNAYAEQGATATDNIDGDITASIVIGGAVDINTIGTYVVTYNVSDSSGNPADEVTRTVLVVEQQSTVNPGGGGGGGGGGGSPLPNYNNPPNGGEAPVVLQSEDEEGTVELAGDEESADEMGMTRAEILKAVMAIYEIPALEEVNEKPFPDVAIDKWYAPYIASAKNHGIVNGYGDGLFRPEREISRAETIKILLEASGMNIVQGIVSFSDTPEYAWYQGYIYYAVSLDIVDGDTDGTFGPEEKITHAEFEELSANLWGAL